LINIGLKLFTIEKAKVRKQF